MEDIFLSILYTLVVLVPVAGLTLRFAVKPLLESWIRVLEVRSSNEEVELLEKRVSLLERELHETRGEIEKVREEREFYRELSPESG